MYKQGILVDTKTPNTPETDWSQHGRPAPCVIAQQYSSTTFVSLRYHSGKEKFTTRLKKFHYF